MEISALIALGVLIGIALFSLKSGMGCGFASLNRREIFYVASAYFILSIIMGYLIGVIPAELTSNILATGLTMHIVIALGLLYFGIETKKSWISKRRDISRKSFLWLSVPCPVCLTATFLACMTLSSLLDLGNVTIGLIVGTIFFAGISITSLSIASFAQRLHLKGPSSLGTVMILFGLFYLLSPIIIPAYIQAQSFPSFEVPVNLKESFLSFLLITLLVASGFFSDRMNLFPARRGG